MDDTNWAILTALQSDARLSYSELGRRVHLSPPAVADRVRRLEEAGVITGYRAVVDATALGWTVRDRPDVVPRARCVLRDPDVPNWPEIMSVDRVTGDTCSVLRLRARSIEHFERVIDALAEFGRPSSSMVLSTPLRWKPVERFTNDSNPATQA
ncbi:MAG: Lrp/AsnC family transcriptional regulator [Actinobacteria bacterium]|nr:Lrp/AsnC family transcriptional regulator [Actinomycetota bacterium]